MTSKANSRNRFLLFAAAFLFSTGGAAIKATSLSAWQVAGFRSAIAAIVIALLVPPSRRNWSLHTAAVGCAYAATLVLFVLANKTTTAANAIFLQATAPLYLVFIGPLFLGERTTRQDLAVFAAIASGAALLLYGSRSQPPTSASTIGNVVAGITGFTWALTLAGLRWLGKRDPTGNAGIATVVVGNVIAFALCLPLSFPADRLSIRDAGIIVYLGVFQVGLAYVCLTKSIRYVPAVEAAVLLLVEPVFNPVWTWLVQSERPSNLALAG
ncbi:MAG: DMT family transporter, partial [Acidobacteriota bacterium]|nr:DMT family transporter [Acidobacteriota bacterium]